MESKRSESAGAAGGGGEGGVWAGVAAFAATAVSASVAAAARAGARSEASHAAARPGSDSSVAGDDAADGKGGGKGEEIFRQYRAPALSAAEERSLVMKANQALARGLSTTGASEGGASGESASSALTTRVTAVEGEFCFYLAVDLPGGHAALPPALQTRLSWILRESHEPDGLTDESVLREGASQLLVEVGPRSAFTSAFSTNATSICGRVGIPLRRMERFRRYLFTFEGDVPTGAARKALVEAVHDRMTEMEVDARVGLTTFSSGASPAPWGMVPLGRGGRAALEAANASMGLGLDAQDIGFLLDYFRKLGRDPTTVELFDLAQSNSEHSRHWFFKGRMVVDGEEQETSLMELVSRPLSKVPGNSVIAFHDNSSVIRGYTVPVLVPAEPGAPSHFAVRPRLRHPLLTAETHNFPTGVAPFPGAATGTGGRIRDTQSTGRGSFPVASIAAYCVGSLHLPGHSLPWEAEAWSGVGDGRPWHYPRNLASPREIAVAGSNGASAYGNEFGEPVIGGFFRSAGFEWGGRRREWLKPIMFSAGIGSIDGQQVAKKPAEPGHLVVKIGGPAYRIGMGGSAASSVGGGEASEEAEFGAVQRGDPEMGQKLNRVVRACAEMGLSNPILSIHDQGAGGNCNVLKEIAEPGGARLDIRAVSAGDPTLSVVELWGAEYQESDALLLHPRDKARFLRVCERERTVADFVGEASGDGRVLVRDSADGTTPVDLVLDGVLAGAPRKTFALDHVSPPPARPFVLPWDDATEGETEGVGGWGGEGVGGWREAVAVGSPCSALADEGPLARMLDRVLRLPHVASKRWLTNKVDRSVTGLVAQQPCVGATGMPLADFAAVALSAAPAEAVGPWADVEGSEARRRGDGGAVAGTVSAVGERPLVGLGAPGVMARAVVAEAMTNMAGCLVEGRDRIKASGNWMYAAKLPGEGALLWDAAVALRDALEEVHLAIDGGKDSLSMSAKVEEETVVAPGALVLTLYAPSPDVRRALTPDVKRTGSVLLWVPCGKPRAAVGEGAKMGESVEVSTPLKAPLGGSSLAQAFSQLGAAGDVPAVDLKAVAAAFDTVQRLLAGEGPVGDDDAAGRAARPVPGCPLLACHDVSDGGLIVALLEMALAGNVGLDVRLGVPTPTDPGLMAEGVPGETTTGEDEDEEDASVPPPLVPVDESGRPVLARRTVEEWLFAECPGLVVEVAVGDVVAVQAAFGASGVRAYPVALTTDEDAVRVSAGVLEVSTSAVPATPAPVGPVLLQVAQSAVRMAWEDTSLALERDQTVAECVTAERAWLARLRPSQRTPVRPLTFAPTATPPPLLRAPALRKHAVAVLREEGSNGDREMASALFAAGFAPWDVTVSDLTSGAISLRRFRGLVAVGGFSFADALGSGKGWAATLTGSARVRAEAEAFRARGDTWTLGVCNGCQLLSLLGWVGPDSGAPETPDVGRPRFLRNTSGRFESRWSAVRVMPSNSVLLRGMEGSVLGVWVAHGEGRFHTASKRVAEAIDADNLAPLRYADWEGNPTEDYPENPNGSPGGIAALSSPDGRVLAMMPHPERCFLPWQLPHHEGGAPPPVAPWLRLFQNARSFCDEE